MSISCFNSWTWFSACEIVSQMFTHLFFSLMPSLLKTVRAVFEKIPDVVKRKTTYSLPDSRKDQHITDNLKTLFGIAQVTSDTNVRERLDRIEPAYLQTGINKIIARMQRGKQLELFRSLKDHYLIALDGTGYFFITNRAL